MKSLVLILYLLTLISVPVTAQTLTLDSLFTMVAESHPLINQLNLNVDIEEERRRSYLGNKDWFLTLRPSYMHSKLITTSSFSPKRIDEVGLTASAKRNFWSTGGALALDFSSTMTDQSLPSIDIPGGGPGSEINTGLERLYEHSFSLNYTQPLIRNYKGKLDRLQYDLAAYTIDVTEMQAMENQEKFLFDIGNKFLDWVLYFQQRKIAEERLELARRQLEQSEAKFEANLVDKVDVLRSEDAVRKARQNLVLIESRITAQKAELAVLAKNQSITDKEPAYDLFQLKDLPSIDMAYNDALIRSRMVNTLKVRRDQLEENLEGFKEIGEPTLDLGLGAGLKGGDRQFGESIVLDKPDFMASLLFTKPLGNTSAEADITRTELQIKQNRYQIEKTSLDLESSITNILIQLRELESVLKLNREEIESAKLRTEEETKLYNQGRSDLSFVIQSQDNVQNARLLYAENAASYHKLYLRYRELTDQILLTKGSD